MRWPFNLHEVLWFRFEDLSKSNSRFDLNGKWQSQSDIVVQNERNEIVQFENMSLVKCQTTHSSSLYGRSNRRTLHDVQNKYPQNIMFLMDESVKWENNVCFMKKKLLTWVSDAEIIQTSLLFFFSQLTTCQTWTPFWSCTLWMMNSHLMRLFRISSSSGKRRSAIKPLFWWPTRRI